MHILDTLIIFNLIWDCLALNKKAMSFEMSVRIHQSTWCNGSEDFNFHKYRCKSETRSVNIGLYADLIPRHSALTAWHWGRKHCNPSFSRHVVTSQEVSIFIYIPCVQNITCVRTNLQIPSSSGSVRTAIKSKPKKNSSRTPICCFTPNQTVT